MIQVLTFVFFKKNQPKAQSLHSMKGTGIGKQSICTVKKTFCLSTGIEALHDAMLFWGGEASVNELHFGFPPVNVRKGKSGERMCKLWV